MTILSVFPENTRINEHGHLEIGRMDALEVAAEFATPLFVYDEKHLRNNCRRYMEAFESQKMDFAVAYAAKAFLCVALAELAEEEGLWLDVSSGGELYTALSAGFPPEKIVFHGNNKTHNELEMAVEYGVRYLVIDNFNEIEYLDGIIKRKGRKQQVLIRVTPGIIPSTHTYIQTGQMDSKFGFGLATGLAMEAVIEVLSRETLALKGFHIHIGSQIFALNSFEKAVEVMASFISDVKLRTGFEAEVVNLGGGLGIKYRVQDVPATIPEYVKALVGKAKEEFSARNVSMPLLMIEPGRSIVGNTCVTLYTIGSVKEIPGIRIYVAVDGGMSDNLRPMLYGAVYEAVIANKMKRDPNVKVTIAGKHCESGDILVKDTWLPEPEPGDVLAIPATGAYGYAMANNYNLQPRPEVIFVSQGEVKRVIRRETYDDLIKTHFKLHGDN